MRKHLIFFIILLGLVISSCSSTQPTTVGTPVPPTATPMPPTPTKPPVSCPDEEVENYLEDFDFLLEEWDDAQSIAESTPRMSLSTAIKDLQDIKRDARRMDRPECADYVQDLYIIAMEQSIDSLISFLGQDSDTVVARKMEGAEKARNIADKEFEKFAGDPLESYFAFGYTTDEILTQLEQAEPFALPPGWKNVDMGSNDQLILSVPEDWEASLFGTDNDVNQFIDKQTGLDVRVLAFDGPVYTELETDYGRLFSLQSYLETQDVDYYSERSAEVGLYALNKGYVVEYSVRTNSGDDIEDEMQAIIVTPNGDEILVIAYTDRDEFTQTDQLNLQGLFSSIRNRSEQ